MSDPDANLNLQAALNRVTVESLLAVKIVTLLTEIHNRQRDYRGYVTWDATTPVGVATTAHTDSILGAGALGLQFCDTTGSDEWLAARAMPFTYIRTASSYQPADHAQDFGDLVYCGRLKGIPVFLIKPAVKSVVLAGVDHTAFFTGTLQHVARGSVLNSPIGRPVEREAANAQARHPFFEPAPIGADYAGLDPLIWPRPAPMMDDVDDLIIDDDALDVAEMLGLCAKNLPDT